MVLKENKMKRPSLELGSDPKNMKRLFIKVFKFKKVAFNVFIYFFNSCFLFEPYEFWCQFQKCTSHLTLWTKSSSKISEYSQKYFD